MLNRYHVGQKVFVLCDGKVKCGFIEEVRSDKKYVINLTGFKVFRKEEDIREYAHEFPDACPERKSWKTSVKRINKPEYRVCIKGQEIDLTEEELTKLKSEIAEMLPDFTAIPYPRWPYIDWTAPKITYDKSFWSG